MLILVTVTVNVAMNGGLFEKSQDTKAKTDKNSEKEQLISAAVGALEEGANFNIQDMTLPEGATWITEKGGDPIEHQNLPGVHGNWVKTSKGNQFYIDNKGNVLDEEPSTEDPVTNIEDTIEGTYYIGGERNKDYIVLNSNGTTNNVYISAGYSCSGTYTYNSTTKEGQITFVDKGETQQYNFTYDVITDGSQNVINKLFTFDKGNHTYLFTTNGSAGLMSLTGYTYSDGNGNTIRFYEVIEDGLTFGFMGDYPVVEDYYSCYNGMIFTPGYAGGEGGYTLSNNNNTLTKRGYSGNPDTVYTKQP